MNPKLGMPTAACHLPTTGPFNLEVTVRLLQRRPSNPIDRWSDGRYLRAMRTPDGLRLVSVTNGGSIDAPDLQLEMYGDSISEVSHHAIVATTRWVLGLDAEPVPTDWLMREEPRFGPVANALRGFRTPCFPNLFETCLAVIPFQQLSLDAGVAILGRLIERLSPPLRLGGETWRDFPSPEAVADASPDALREDGLSRAKVSALQALAREAIAGGLNAARFHALSTETAIKELQRLPGIGPWSANILLLRGLRRMDLFPPGDTGSARGLTALLGRSDLLTPAEATAFAARFGERRGYLYFLCLGGQLVTKGIIGEMASSPPGPGEPER